MIHADKPEKQVEKRGKKSEEEKKMKKMKDEESKHM